MGFEVEFGYSVCGLLLYVGTGLDSIALLEQLGSLCCVWDFKLVSESNSNGGLDRLDKF